MNETREWTRLSVRRVSREFAALLMLLSTAWENVSQLTINYREHSRTEQYWRINCERDGETMD